jgi:membrane protease YdiL (CAAX protease family)
VGVASFAGMKRLQIGFSLAGFSFFAILLLRYVRIPFMDPSGSASNIAAFVVLGLVFLFFIKRFNLPTNSYFRLPRITPISIFALIVAGVVIVSALNNEDNEMKPWKVAIPGILFLLSIGFGEEMVSRGFVYGVLKRRSNKVAIFISSLLFGLMHLNLYIGSDWDPWLAYWHVASTFCFGFFMCALLIATESFWVPVIAHALFNWSIVFDKTPPVFKDIPPISFPFWEGLVSPFADLIFIFTPGALIFFFMKPRRIWAPRWLKTLAVRIAIRWKLVEESTDKPELVGHY